eukprot:COSAG02_NODE_66894_length_254_cov_0.670968_1_plen_46_part_01
MDQGSDRMGPQQGPQGPQTSGLPADIDDRFRSRRGGGAAAEAFDRF